MRSNVRSSGAFLSLILLAGCGGGGGTGFIPGALGASGGGGSSPSNPVSTPAPVVSPTHYPLVVSPATISLSNVGDSGTVSVSEIGYAGKTITYTGGCAGIASIAPSSEVANSSGSASFVITASKSNASCRPVFSDVYGQSGSTLTNVGSPASPAPTVKPTISPVQPTATPVPVGPTATPVPATPKPTTAPTSVPTVAPTAQPTQAPTPAPTQPPAYGVLTVTPKVLNLGNQNPDTGSFTLSETNYPSTFGETNTCAGIATVTPPVGGGIGPSSVYAVQDIAGGTCAVTFTDNHGGSTSATIIVTQYSIIIQSKNKGSN